MNNKLKGLIILIVIFSILLALFFNDNYLDSKQSYIKHQDKIYLNETIKNIINERILNSSGIEFEYCIYADIYKDSLIINDAYEPEIYYANSTEISSHSCIGRSLGKIHYHPNGYCAPSEADINNSYLESNFSGIVCDTDKYVFYDSWQLKETLNIIIINASNNLEQDITLRSNKICNKGLSFCNNSCWEQCIDFKCINGEGICCDDGLWCGNECYEKIENFKCINNIGKTCDGVWCEEECYDPFCEEGTFECQGSEGVCV